MRVNFITKNNLSLTTSADSSWLYFSCVKKFSLVFFFWWNPIWGLSSIMFLASLLQECYTKISTFLYGAWWGSEVFSCGASFHQNNKRWLTALCLIHRTMRTFPTSSPKQVPTEEAAATTKPNEAERRGTNIGHQTPGNEFTAPMICEKTERDWKCFSHT